MQPLIQLLFRTSSAQSSALLPHRLPALRGLLRLLFAAWNIAHAGTPQTFRGLKVEGVGEERRC